MKKIKVIEAVHQLGLGGTEYALQLYSKFLDKAYFEVTVVALNEGGARVKLIEDLNIKVIILDGDLQRLGEMLKETDVFHLHSNGLLDQDLYQVIKANRPKMMIQTNVFGLFDPATYDVIDYDLYISKMILVRRMNLDKTSKQLFAAKRKVLPYPVDVQHITSLLPNEVAIRRFKEEKQLKDFFIVGRIGRADNNKFDLITLDGFKLFANQLNEARFLLLGATPEILSHADKLGIIHKLIIFENTSDLQELLFYYKSIDIFLAASAIGESFGMVIAEAMTAGTPVVTISTENRDNAQIELVDNQKTGLVVKPVNKEIAAALMHLYKNANVRENLSAASKRKIEKFYKAEKIVKSLETLIFSHLKIKSESQSESLISDFSKELVNDYLERCLNLYGKPGWLKQLQYRFKKVNH